MFMLRVGIPIYLHTVAIVHAIEWVPSARMCIKLLPAEVYKSLTDTV